MTKQNDLLRTLEEIREKEYPDIPSKLIKDIFEIESENVEDRTNAYKQIEKLLEKYINEVM